MLRISVFVAACAVLVVPADAQNFATFGTPETILDDPCSHKVDLQMALKVGDLTGLWGDPARLAAFAVDIRARIGDYAYNMLKGDETWSTVSKTRQNEIIAELVAVNHCFPWIDALLTRIENRLRELGVTNISISNDREHVQREAFFRAFRAEWEKNKTSLRDMLKRRG